MTSATLTRSGRARTSVDSTIVTTRKAAGTPLRTQPAPRGITRPTGRPIGQTSPAGRADAPMPGVAPTSTRCGEAVGRRGSKRPASAVDARRRATALGVLAGLALAVSVWVIGIVGNNYAESQTPSPTSTQVTHVRAGDSLSTIAARVAPDVPRQVVIDEILELNDLESSGLRVGQPLLTPAYR
uniref:LysM peptidoglycan-binding domain-containing protein n=1 Tax=Gordonia sp. B7-2 TaxID=3420932 RepID=UPI003D93FB7B